MLGLKSKRASDLAEMDSISEDNESCPEIEAGDGDYSDANVESICISDASIHVTKPTHVIDLRQLGNIVAKPGPLIESGRIKVLTEMRKVRKNEKSLTGSI
jgi:hypothetical protein